MKGILTISCVISNEMINYKLLHFKYRIDNT